jgi:hypothetical protein
VTLIATRNRVHIMRDGSLLCGSWFKNARPAYSFEKPTCVICVERKAWEERQ